jgi:virginiamycin A acetyltransferase
MIKISSTARISSLADIEDSVRGTKITIEDNVVIDSFVKFKPAGGTGDIFIGAGTVINSGCVLYTGNGVKIGKGCAIAANCTFASTNHAYKLRSVQIVNQGFLPSKGGITLGDDVWIGANCVILDGANIETGCVIAAGSIIRGNLESYGIYAGHPLQKIGTRK